MAFPITLQGSEGEQYSTYTDQRWPLGTQLVLQDGRKFRFAQAGGSTLVPGNVLTAAANIANHVDTTAVASAAGSTSPQTTLGATAATINQYAEGYAVVVTTPDLGRTYKIDNHAAVASAGVLTANLVGGYSVITAWTTSSRVSLIKNSYHAVIQAPITTLTAAPVGVAVTAPTTTVYCWVATSGLCGALYSGTLVLGNNASAVVAAAGATGPSAASTTAVIGRVQQVAAGTLAPIFLTLD